MFGYVETKEPVQGMTIATPVFVRSPLSWSLDNKIALATQVGTYIFALKLSPDNEYPGLLFDRIFLPPPTISNPYFTKGMHLPIINSLTKEKSHSMMLDARLSAAKRAENELQPHLIHLHSAEVFGDTNHVGYCKAIWSPTGLSPVDGSFLCLITYDHQISLIGEIDGKWKTLVDLSALWSQYLQSDGYRIIRSYHKQLGSSAYDYYLSRNQILTIYDIVWTSLYRSNGDDTVHTILIVILGSNHVVFWKIPKYQHNKCDVRIIGCFQLDLKTVSSSHWHPLPEDSGYLLLGTNEGDVNFFHVTFEKDNVDIKFIGNPKEFDHGLSTNHIELTALDEKNSQYLIFLAKHNIFLASLIKLTLKEVTVIDITHSRVGTLAISGWIVVDSSCLYISCKDGLIKEFSLKADLEAEKVYITKEDLVFNALGFSYSGICSSPNKNLWAILEEVCVPHDHLVLREPTVIKVFQVTEMETICHHLLHKNDKTLVKNFDLFEGVRLYGAKGCSLPLPIFDEDSMESLPPLLKRSWFFFSKIQFSCAETKDKSHYEMLLEKLYNSILADWFEDSITKMEFLDSSDMRVRLSLRLMITFLEYFFSFTEGKKEQQITTFKNKNIEMIDKLKNKINFSEVDDEKCLTCNTAVQFTPPCLSGVCLKGHSLPRCPRSLLTTCPTLLCVCCSLFYDPVATEWFDTKKCLICDGQLVFKISLRPRGCAPAPTPPGTASPRKKRRNRFGTEHDL